MNKTTKQIIFKTLFFILSLSIGWFLVESGYLHAWISGVLPHKFIAEIIAGSLYTSFLTSPIAVAMFLVIAENSNPILTALLGGLGAALGDLILVRFFRDNYKDTVSSVSKELHIKKIENYFQKIHLKFLIPLIGAIIIASPFPDEIGLLMLGVTKLKYREIAVISFVLNSAGILLIVTPINLLS